MAESSVGILYICQVIKLFKRSSDIQSISFVSGYYLGSAGEMDCTSYCQTMLLNCVTDMDTENTTGIFEEKGVNCSQDDSQRKYSTEFHPAYYPESGKCVGYYSVPQEVKCKASQGGHSEKIMRICNCMNKGKACFELSDNIYDLLAY